MYRNHTVAVVVPAYNEEGLVGSVIDTVPSFVDRVYAIDDRSTDGTWDEICRHAERINSRTAQPPIVTDGGGFNDRVVTLRNEQNRGVGYTVIRGYRRALRDDIDVVAVMNGDGQMDPDVLDRILDPVVSGEAAYAKGDRLSDPAHRDEMSGWRLFGNQLLTLLTRVASGDWSVTDTQNGYTAISREALETIPLDELYQQYGFLNDVIVTLSAYDFEIADVPHSALYGEEQSGIQYRSFVPTLSALLVRDFVWRLKRQFSVAGPDASLCLYAVGAASLVLGATTSVLGLLSATGSIQLPGQGLVAPTLVVGFLSLLLAVGSEATAK